MHKTTWPTLIATVLAMVALVLLMALDLEIWQYKALKWSVFVALIFAAGFYLNPRKMAVLEDPDELENDNEDHPLKPTPRVWRHIDAQWSRSTASKVIVNRLEQTADVVGSDGTLDSSDHAAIQRIVHEPAAIRPISTTIAILHLVIAVLMNPLVMLSLTKPFWIVFDSLVLVYLIVAVGFLLVESGPGLKPSLVQLDGELNAIDPRNVALNNLFRIARRTWFAVLVFLVAMAMMVYPAGGLEHWEQFIPVCLGSVLGSAIGTFAICKVASSCGLPSAMQSDPWECWIPVFLVLFARLVHLELWDIWG